MANVRCPMCSKLNPPEAETCSFCGARLKPANPSAPSASSLPGGRPGGSAEEEPDWLRSLRTEPTGTPAGEESPENAQKPGEADDSVPDWLSRIRERTRSDQENEPPEGQGGEQSWLQDLQQSQPAEPASDMDWLNRLPGEPTAPTGAEQPPELPEKGEASDLLSSAWMSDLPQNPPAGEAEGPAEGEDWMSKLSAWEPSAFEEHKPGEVQPPAAQEKGEGGDFDWLENFNQEQPGSQPVTPAPDSGDISMDSLLLTLNEPPSEPSPQPGEASALSGWEESPAAQPQENLPSWLNELPSAGAPPAQEGGETGLPDWLQGEGEPPAPPVPPAQPEPATGPIQPADELPAWLFEESAQNLPEPAQSTPPEAAVEGQEAGSVSPLMEETPAEEQPALQESTAMDIPGWLSEFGAGTAQNEPAEAAPGDAPAGAPEAAAAEPPKAEQLPVEPAAPAAPAVFLDQEEQYTSQKPPETAAEGESPEWLREFDTQAPSNPVVPPLIEEEAQAHPLEADQPFAVELPDWLHEEAEQKAEETEQPVQLAGEPLAQAELPEWVKEMRPIESIIPGEAQIAETERKPEKTGPLAGLSGILPAEELVSRYRKPPVYSVKLHVSEKQRGQASQLDNILAQETQPLLIPPQGKGVQSTVLRIIVALLLIAVLAAPLLLQMPAFALPALYPVEMQKMFDQLENNLPADTPVLLAVDYEPALAGEMRLASTPVIEQLMAKNVRMVIVSTRPAGAALAEQLLVSAAERHPGYDLRKMTVNLGYLPGDMISLLEFAHQPAFAAPGNLSGEQAWKGATLKGLGKNINSIQDFSRVIVLTDTAEIGRAWVEQVQTEMGTVPLLMVTSAQAAPMMAPFVETNQVNGMVSGVLGGVMYAQWAKQASPVSAYLASYQVGIALAFALVVIGGLISGGMAMLKRGEREED